MKFDEITNEILTKPKYYIDEVLNKKKQIKSKNIIIKIDDNSVFNIIQIIFDTNFLKNLDNNILDDFLYILFGYKRFEIYYKNFKNKESEKLMLIKKDCEIETFFLNAINSDFREKIKSTLAYKHIILKDNFLKDMDKFFKIVSSLFLSLNIKSNTHLALIPLMDIRGYHIENLVGSLDNIKHDKIFIFTNDNINIEDSILFETKDDKKYIIFNIENKLTDKISTSLFFKTIDDMLKILNKKYKNEYSLHFFQDKTISLKDMYYKNNKLYIGNVNDSSAVIKIINMFKTKYNSNLIINIC